MGKASIIKELLGYLWKKKLWWLIPVILILVFFGAIAVFVQTSALAPILYPLF